jgi:hypothetical protein
LVRLREALLPYQSVKLARDVMIYMHIALPRTGRSSRWFTGRSSIKKYRRIEHPRVGTDIQLEVKNRGKAPEPSDLYSYHTIIHIIHFCRDRDIFSQAESYSKTRLWRSCDVVYAETNRVVIITMILSRARVLSSNALSLRGNTTLLSGTVSALLTAVKEIGIVLSDLRRILGGDLVDGLLEIALLC